MNNCDAPGLMPISDALTAMSDAIQTIAHTETISLMKANNRVLAKDVLSTINVPPEDNSAMDGFAIIASDLAKNNRLQIAGTSLAGSPFAGELRTGQCVRIMTGGVIPKGADCVVMQEQVAVQDDMATFSYQPNCGENVRCTGEDIKEDEVVVSQGTLLTPAHLSLIASVGVDSCLVFCKPKVAIIATGDELTPAGEPLKPGAIYESNRYALTGLLENVGAEVTDFGIIEDAPDKIELAFLEADKRCDLIITCGGVSVGEADYVKQVLEKLGSINFWKVAIKPGKPFAFGKLSNAWFCGLPGNPVSSYVTFEQLVIPLLRKLSGMPSKKPLELAAITEAPLRKRPGRADFQRGVFRIDEHGKVFVKAQGRQGSGIMSSVARANCYIVLDKDCDDVPQGTQVFIQPFSQGVK